MDEINTLHYLDAVVREGLRVDSPVTASERVACEDCVIPVDNEYLDKHGRIRREIRLNKGDAIFIAAREINKSKELWGKNAAEFIPERWGHPLEASKNILAPTAISSHSCLAHTAASASALPLSKLKLSCSL